MVFGKVVKTVNTYRMLDRGNRIVVAVSGGPDSVCLLTVLQELSAELGLSLHVAHLDHGFRAAESEADARFVSELAQSRGILSTVRRVDVPAYCRERGLAAPAGAREVRYRFLNDVAAAVGADRIALGHTANDQAETLLMRLIRGAGPSGLSGIPPVRGNIIRPLIETTRTEVMDYLRQRKTPFVTDSSNLKPLYTRNRIRQEILPLLEQYNPRIIETLAAEASILREENEALESLLEQTTAACLRREEEAVRIDRKAFEALPPAHRRRVLRGALAALAGDSPGLTLVQTNEALAFLERTQSGRAMELRRDILLEREYDSFLLRPRPDGVRKASVRLQVPGTTVAEVLSLEVETAVRERSAGGPEAGNYLWQALFDYDKIALPLFIRTRREGDWFQPSGMGGRGKKLKEYFIDEKIPRAERDRVPLLATEQDIVWVVGMRTDGRFLPDAGTKRFLRVTVRSEDERESQNIE